MNQLQKILQNNPRISSNQLRLAHHQWKALGSMERCRTARLGGHAQYCEKGHLHGVWYNSCKHRFCPQCNQMKKSQWIDNLERILLNCAHHHIVFTIPSELNVLWRYNREVMSDVLFKSVKLTIQEFSQDKKYLGAMPGILMALHTWGRSLNLHPHIHAVVSHGGLNESGEWKEPKKKHLFPQKPVMLVFRGKMLSALSERVEAGELKLPVGDCLGKTLNTLQRLYRKQWTVNFSDRYDHARGVAKYLGRYVKGGPFNLNQIKRSKGGVEFKYKSHRTKKIESLSLSEEGFVERILEHVSVPRKPTVRYGGLYVSSVRKKLNKAREALGQKVVPERKKCDWRSYLESLSKVPRCKECGRLVVNMRPLDRAC